MYLEFGYLESIAALNFFQKIASGLVHLHDHQGVPLVKCGRLW